MLLQSVVCLKDPSGGGREDPVQPFASLLERLNMEAYANVFYE